MTSKYRANSNERLYKEDNERNVVLKNSQSQGQLLKRNH